MTTLPIPSRPIPLPPLPALLALAAAFAAAGCGDSTSVEDAKRDFRVTKYDAQLTQTATCEDLLEGFKDDGRVKIDQQAADYIRWYVEPEENYYGGGGGSDGGVAAPENDSAGGGDDKGAPDDFSETNTQVEGVDEADIVKTDGYYIYALSGSRLFVVDSWPATDLSLKKSIEIEGYTHEMFVSDGRAVVFSQTDDPTFTAPSHCAETENYYYDCWSPRSFTKITVIDAITGEPSVARELFVEGYYNTSRRYEDLVRVVLSNWNDYMYWSLPQVWEYLDKLSTNDQYWWDSSKSESRKQAILGAILDWRADAHAEINDTTLEDWVPRRYERDGDELAAIAPDCAGFFLPQPGLVDYGMTQIVGFDLAAPTATPTQSAVAGYTHAVYSSADALVLAQWDWSGWYRAYLEGADRYETLSFLHRFELGSNGSTSYQGSASIEGNVNNQFSLDEKDGILRVAASYSSWPVDWESTATTLQNNRVYTLAPEGDRLKQLGSTGPLAEGESIQSVRFVGDIGYVVTFRQVDPLFAIDLSDPANPTVLGELKIPGFSTYMHPIDDDHLLTIGYDATDEGAVTGMALQIFDVSDPTAPALAHKHMLDSSWGYSEAAWNHKAFTFYPHLGTLAFPYSSWGENWDTYRSSLEVFHVDVEDGFEKLGSIAHTDLVKDMCGGFTEEWEKQNCAQGWGEVRRGVFIEDNVYSISYGGIVAHDLEDLNTALGTVKFPTDGLQNYYYGWGWWGFGGGVAEGDAQF
jgi:hypothetical protein